MLNKLLQARYRYLQARRDLEYEQLKEAEKAALKMSLGVPKVVEMKNTGSLVCPTCGKDFVAKSGLASHMRNKTCEKIKDC